MGSIVDHILKQRGYAGDAREAFLLPSYDACRHDPFLLPDMQAAVDRLCGAKEKNELIYIYGDYDIDGLTATTLLLDAFRSFGICAKAFIPNRFTDGYGLNKDAITMLAAEGAQLVVTVDCGSLSHEEIAHAHTLGVDVIVTDHHTVADTMPLAVATINPKRKDHAYPFTDLAGVGVAFKLVQALQQRLSGLGPGQEKWLLDLVALGTVCDVVSLVGENRANVFWGLQVLQKTRRPGIKALAAVAGLKENSFTARSLGFVLGPHLNAAGRLETAQLSLDLLTATDPMNALTIAYQLREMNLARRSEQDRIVKEATQLAMQFADDPVLVVSHPSWSHGIIGIVAAKLLETFQKPAFVLQELGEESKGSARSYGDFSAVEGIRAAEQWLIKGGGHKLAAGVTLKTQHIPHFRKAINDFYKGLALKAQEEHFYPVADVVVQDFADLTLDVINDLKRLEPYGNGNAEPVFEAQNVEVLEKRTMGKEGQHIKLQLKDKTGRLFAMVGFNQSAKALVEVGARISVWFCLIENEWRGNRAVEGRLLRIVVAD